MFPNWVPYTLPLIAFLVYAGTITHGFVLDDIAVIEKNKLVQKGLAGIPEILTTFYWKGFWNLNAGLFRPLSLVMFALEYELMPQTPWIHHLVNVGLYSLTIFLLYKCMLQVFKNLTPWMAFAVTLIFALHPIHTEVVANIKGRDEILCFLFFLLSSRVLFKPGELTLKDQLKSAGFFMLALLSKEAAILYLPVWMLYFIILRTYSFKKTALLLVPHVLVGLVWLAWFQAVIRLSPDPVITYTYHDNSLVACGSYASRLATGIGILGRYMLKSVWPYQLSYDYSFNQIPCVSFAAPLVWFTLLAVGGLVFLAFRVRRSHPMVTFSIGYFFITILLTSNLVTLIGTTMADRLLFAPLLGPVMLVVYGLYVLTRQTQPAKSLHTGLVFFLVVGCLYAYKTTQRNKDWKSNATLFTADVKNAPQSARVHFNYGTLVMGSLPAEIKPGDSLLIREGIVAFEKALQIDSLDAGAYTNLGSMYFKNKEYAKSVMATSHALAINPADSTLYGNLADAYFRNNDFDSALTYYSKSIAKGVVNKNTYNFMGVTWFSKKDYSKAIETFEKGIAVDSTYGDLWLNYGNALAISNRFADALVAFEKAYQLNPALKQALYFIALTYQNLGNAAKAQEYVDKFNAANQ